MPFYGDDMDEIMERHIEAGNNPNSLTKELCFGVSEHLAELDSKIEQYSHGWKKDRIPRTTLSILRLALFEMLYMDSIPASVSINEAVELCKEFATPEDGAFVNGILSSVLGEGSGDGV